jgi:hypothetical protein
VRFLADLGAAVVLPDDDRERVEAVAEAVLDADPATLFVALADGMERAGHDRIGDVHQALDDLLDAAEWVCHLAQQPAIDAAAVSCPAPPGPPAETAQHRVTVAETVSEALAPFAAVLADLARAHGGVVIEHRPLPAATTGLFLGHDPVRILVDAEVTDPDSIRWVVGHEVGHAIDPLLGPDDPRPYRDAERWADRVAVALVNGWPIPEPPAAPAAASAGDVVARIVAFALWAARPEGA